MRAMQGNSGGVERRLTVLVGHRLGGVGYLGAHPRTRRARWRGEPPLNELA